MISSASQPALAFFTIECPFDLGLIVACGGGGSGGNPIIAIPPHAAPSNACACSDFFIGARQVSFEL